MANTQNSTITVRERLDRELNVIAWAFECQFMEASSTSATPMIHSKGRYLAGYYHITSNIEMLKLQDYIEHYTHRFENANSVTLVKNELLRIYEKTNNILEYYNKNLTGDCEIIKQFNKDTPEDFKARIQYFENHKGKVITQDLYPQDIVFGKDSEHPDWSKYSFNYLTNNDELASFCQKLIQFIEDLGKINKKTEKTLNDFFGNIKNKESFLLDLKETFTTEKGIDFAILMHLLIENKLLFIGNREFSKFHKLCVIHFNQSIGAKQGINDNYKHSDTDKKNYKSNITIISRKLNPLIIRHKEQKV